MGPIETGFGLAVAAVFVLSLWVEHASRRNSDLAMAATMVLILWVLSNVLTDNLGTVEALKWFPALDAGGTLVSVWLCRRRMELWRIVLALIYASMCVLHVVYRLGGEHDAQTRYGYILALNLGTALTLLAVAFPGGRYVVDAARRALSRRRGLRGLARAPTHRSGRQK